MYNIKWTEVKKEKLLKKLNEYYSKYGLGECIMQSDDAQIEGLELLCHIADDILINDEGITYNEE